MAIKDFLQLNKIKQPPVQPEPPSRKGLLDFLSAFGFGEQAQDINERLRQQSQASPVGQGINRVMDTAIPGFQTPAGPVTVRTAVEEISPNVLFAGGLPASYKTLQAIDALPQLVKSLTEKGVSSAGRTALQKALDTGLDRWIATKGRLNPADRTAFQNMILKDRNWLIQRATENMLKRQATAKTARTGVRKAAQEAADDTIRELDTRLLKAPEGTTQVQVPPEVQQAAQKVGKLDSGKNPLVTKEPWQMTRTDYINKGPEGVPLKGRTQADLELLNDTKKNPDKYLFHATVSEDSARAIEQEGLLAGGLSGRVESGYAQSPEGFVLVFKRSDIPRGMDTGDVALAKGYKPIKPIGVFKQKEYGGHITYNARMQELGDLPEPPDVTHYEIIRQALASGKPVPPEVLKDYPDLKPEKGTSVTPEVTKKNTLVQNAIRELGTTINPREAGYLLEDGVMLDFSGKREGGLPGGHDMDHREAGRAYPEDYKLPDRENYLTVFERDTNAIRYFETRDGDVNFSVTEAQKITSSQVAKLKKLLRGKIVNFDFYNDNGSVLWSEELDNARLADINTLIAKIQNAQGAINKDLAPKPTATAEDITAQRSLPETPAQNVEQRAKQITSELKRQQRYGSSFGSGTSTASQRKKAFDIAAKEQEVAVKDTKLRNKYEPKTTEELTAIRDKLVEQYDELNYSYPSDIRIINKILSERQSQPTPQPPQAKSEGYTPAPQHTIPAEINPEEISMKEQGLPQSFIDLHKHSARIEGLRNSTPEEVASYLSQLRELANGYPDMKKMVLQASRAYAEGDLTEATILAENILSEMHNKLADETFAMNTAKMAEKAPKADALFGESDAGIQRSMMGDVPEQEVRVRGKGKVTQANMDDLVELREYEQRVSPRTPQATESKSKGINRIEDINALLDTKGRLPQGQGTRPELKLELARLEAEQEASSAIRPESLDRIIEQTQNELGNRSMPYHGGSRNLFPEYDVKQLDEYLKVLEQARSKLASASVKEIQEKGRVAPKSVKPSEAKYAHIEAAAPDGPKPPKPPKPPAKQPSDRQGKDPDEILRDITDKKTFGERADQTLLRRHEAARSNLFRRTDITIQEGNNRLKKLGIGVIRQGQLVPREEDKPILLELYNALHNPSKVESGEIAIPEGFEDVYAELRWMADWDTVSRLDFDPNAAVLEDWFFRGWKPPEGMFKGGTRKGLVTKPRELRMPRVNATFTEMIDAGFEPLFWNPYQQWGYRHNLGELYREQMELVDYLKGMGDELIRPDMGGVLPEGWRIPRIGPAFEGKPFATTDLEGKPAVMFTRRWTVPDAVANTLENIYGRRPNMGKVSIAGKTIDPLKVIDFITFVPKRAKLFGSFFQQVDFLTRSGAGSWTGMVDQLLAGKPIEAVKTLAKYPQTVWKVMEANYSSGKRLELAKQMDSTKPIVTERPGVNLKGISEAGLSTMDVTIFPEDMDKLTRQVAESTGALKKIPQAIADLEGAMRRGLFNGVYPAAIITDIQNNIAPMIIRQFPESTDAQINGMIARIANIKYSTIPASQSVFQNTFMREALRRLFFSVGESEGLLRQAAGAAKGPYSSYWRKHWIGVYLFLIATANLIHWASTGDPLPADRYSPIAKDNWGPLPFGYNTKFAAPTLPIKGRGNTEITLDLVGQMDTALRILDPAFFVSSRTSVPIRATVNQVSGTDFYGAPINDVGPGGIVSRTSQLITDLYSPIGIGGLTTELLRQNIPGASEVINEGESRIGMAGLGIQTTGMNVRSEWTGQLLDRYAAESGYTKADGTPVTSWGDLEPYQKDQLSKNPQLIQELNQRRDTSVERGQPGSKGFATIEALEGERIQRGESLVTEFDSGDLDPNTFRDEVTKLKTEISAKKSQVDEDFQLYKDSQDMPADPNKRALVEYYALYDMARRESKTIDWDKLEQLEADMRSKWTVSQEAYVDRNTGITEWGPKMREYIQAQDTLSQSGYWDITEPNQYEKRMQFRISRPEIESILVKWYGYKPAQPPYSRQQSIERVGVNNNSWSYQPETKGIQRVK